MKTNRTSKKIQKIQVLDVAEIEGCKLICFYKNRWLIFFSLTSEEVRYKVIKIKSFLALLKQETGKKLT